MRTKMIMVLCSLFMTVITLKAANPERIKIMVKENATEQSKQIAKDLQARLNVVQALDYNSLSAKEKSLVRDEVRAIKKEARKADGVYIYLGGGALLLAIILLILLV